MALSDEDDAKVAEYIDQLGLSLRIGAGSKSKGRYGVTGIPSAALIDPQGKLVWSGHPSGLSKGTVQAALKGAKPRSSNFLAIPPASEATGRLAPIGKSMEAGKLGAALKAAEAVAADAKATAEEKTAAAALAGEITAHAELLGTQAEGFVEALDVVRGLSVLDALAADMAGTKPGDVAKARAAEIRKEPALAKELSAAEAFERTKASVAKLASSKAKTKWQEFAKKHEGTRAAERAKAIARAGDK
jgi:hypothetical protein